MTKSNVPKSTRRAELERMRGPQVLKVLLNHVATEVPTPRSEGAKKRMIDIILRFEYQES